MNAERSFCALNEGGHPDSLMACGLALHETARLIKSLEFCPAHASRISMLAVKMSVTKVGGASPRFALHGPCHRNQYQAENRESLSI